MCEKLRYVIRKAAGLYWLIDTCQEENPCRMPLSMNEAGADICRRLLRGMDEEETADELSALYEADRAEIMSDIKEFVRLLDEYGVEYNR